MRFKTERHRTLTLNLSDDEMGLLEALARRKSMTKSAVLRQAVQIYQTVAARRETVPCVRCGGTGIEPGRSDAPQNKHGG